jgi:hypothetical protein
MLSSQLHGGLCAIPAYKSGSSSPGSPSPVDEAADSGSPPCLPKSAPRPLLSTRSFILPSHSSEIVKRRGSGSSGFERALAVLTDAVSALHVTSTAVAKEHSSHGKGGILLTESDVTALLQAVQHLKRVAPAKSSASRNHRRESSDRLSRAASSNSFGEDDSLLETFDAQPHIFDDATKDAVIGFLSPRVAPSQPEDLAPLRRLSTHSSQRRVSLVSSASAGTRSFASTVRMTYVDNDAESAVREAITACLPEAAFLQGFNAWDFDCLERFICLGNVINEL